MFNQLILFKYFIRSVWVFFLIQYNINLLIEYELEYQNLDIKFKFLTLNKHLARLVIENRSSMSSLCRNYSTNDTHYMILSLNLFLKILSLMNKKLTTTATIYTTLGTVSLLQWNFILIQHSNVNKFMALKDERKISHMIWITYIRNIRCGVGFLSLTR